MLTYVLIALGGVAAGGGYTAWRLKQGTSATWWGIVKALGGGPGPFVPPQDK